MGGSSLFSILSRKARTDGPRTWTLSRHVDPLSNASSSPRGVAARMPLSAPVARADVRRRHPARRLRRGRGGPRGANVVDRALAHPRGIPRLRGAPCSTPRPPAPHPSTTSALLRRPSAAPPPPSPAAARAACRRSSACTGLASARSSRAWCPRTRARRCTTSSACRSTPWCSACCSTRLRRRPPSSTARSCSPSARARSTPSRRACRRRTGCRATPASRLEPSPPSSPSVHCTLFPPSTHTVSHTFCSHLLAGCRREGGRRAAQGLVWVGRLLSGRHTARRGCEAWCPLQVSPRPPLLHALLILVDSCLVPHVELAQCKGTCR